MGKRLAILILLLLIAAVYLLALGYYTVQEGYEFYIPDMTSLLVTGVVILIIWTLVAIAYFKIYRPKPKEPLPSGPTPATMNEAELKVEVTLKLKKWISGDSKISVQSVKKTANGFSATATIGGTKVALTLDNKLDLEGVEEIR